MKIPRKHYLDKGNHPIVSQEDDHVSGFTNENDSLNRFEGPVIIFGDHTRVVKYIDFPFAQGADGVKILEPVSNVIPKFMFHQLEFRKPKSLGYARHFRLLKKVCFVNPPLTEQERIVEVLDAAFEAIDKAKANIERNLANARELFQSRLNDIFSNPSADWEVKPLGLWCAIRGGSSVNDLVDEGVAYIKVADLKKGKRFDPLIDVGRFLLPNRVKSPFKKGSVVFPKRGGAIATNRKRIVGVDFWADTNLMVLEPSDELCGEYLFLLIQSIDLSDLASGSAIPQINKYSFDTLEVAIPEINVQRKEVVAFEIFQRQHARLDEEYQRQLVGLEELRQSILEQAFEGKLTEPLEV